MSGAALFDLDGTVMDTPGAIVASLVEMTLSFGRSHPDSALRAQIGRPLDSIVDALLPAIDGEQREQAKQRFRAAFSEKTLPDARRLIHPGAPELIEELRARGVAVAIVTSKITPSAVELLSAAGIEDAFDVVIGHDQVQHGKPAPDSALLAANQLQVAPASCVVIGDSPDDVRMGVAAGMRTIGVTWGIGDASTLADVGADEVAVNVDVLAAQLSSMLRGAGAAA